MNRSSLSLFPNLEEPVQLSLFPDEKIPPSIPESVRDYYKERGLSIEKIFFTKEWKKRRFLFHMYDMV